jgi:cleavage and polyadenylation specificity factor subunit 3
MTVVDVKHTSEDELMLEWSSSASNDMIADSVMAVVVGIDRSPASVKCLLKSLRSVARRSVCSPSSFIRPVTASSQSCSHLDLHPHTDLDAHAGHQSPGTDPSWHAGALRTEKIVKFLEAHFGPVKLVETRETAMVSTSETEHGDENMSIQPVKVPLLSFDPAIVVTLDEWTAWIGLVDLVSCQFNFPLEESIGSTSA